MPYNPKSLGNLQGAFTEEARAKSIATRKARANDKFRKYLEFLAEGKRIGQAADAAGLIRKQIYERRKIDPEFVEAEKQAEAAFADTIEDALAVAALGGNVDAIKQWLANRSKDRWKFGADQKITIENKQTMELEAGPRMERIAALMARLEERKALTAGQPLDIIDAEEVE